MKKKYTINKFSLQKILYILYANIFKEFFICKK